MTKHSIRWIAASTLTLAVVAISSGNVAGQDAPKAIPQPIVKNLKVAPDSARVDLTLPKFSNSTQVTNPYFPVSKQESVLFVGKVDGKPFRTEVTLLPYTHIIKWEGVQIEALVSQYVAYLDGRIQEVAYDLYAQGDDGSVWYLGEDVSDFQDGAINTKEGTWLVTRNGPPAMIMPGNPKVGDTYRTENIPGIAFEEVTVKTVDQTLDGPFGPIKGGLIGTELHFGGSSEDKQFGPGYGEFMTVSGEDVEALALAVPTNRAPGPVPADLALITQRALEVFDAAGSKKWESASTSVQDMTAAWDRYRAGEVPKLVAPMVTGALEALAKAVDQRNEAEARHAAIEAARWSFDIQLRYRPAIEVDLARLDLWAAQLLIDTAARDADGVNSATFAMVYARDRVIHGLDAEAAQQLNVLFGDLQPAAVDEDFEAAAKVAGQMRELLAGLISKS